MTDHCKNPSALVFSMGLLLLLISPARAGLDVLSKQFEKVPLTEIAALFTTGEIFWPALPTAEVIRESPDAERLESYVNLTKILLKRAKEEFASERYIGIDGVAEYCENLFAIERSILKSGGYINGIVGDALAGSASLKMTNYVVENPAEANRLAKILKGFRRENRDVRMFLSILVKGDAEMAKKEIESLVVARAGNLYETLEKIGTAPPVSMSGIHLSTGDLMRRSNVRVALIWRFHNESILQHLLPGLLDFYGRGGTNEKLDSKKMSRFRAIMGEDRRNYGFRPHAIVKLSPSRLKNLVESTMDKDKLQKSLNRLLEY